MFHYAWELSWDVGGMGFVEACSVCFLFCSVLFCSVFPLVYSTWRVSRASHTEQKPFHPGAEQACPELPLMQE